MTDVLRAYEGGRARNCNAKASCRLASVLQPLARTRTLASKSHASRDVPKEAQRPLVGVRVQKKTHFVSVVS